jgi:multicomponent Na+:H+ antiporter subunit D
MMRSDPFPLALGWDLPIALPPSFVFFAAALVVLLARGPRARGLRRTALLAAPLVGSLNLAALPLGETLVWHALGLELVQLRVDRLSLLFGWLFHLGALLGAIYALRVRDPVQHVAALCYAGCALGAIFAGDLITLFCYWEGMAVSSVFLIFARRTAAASAAGLRYLGMQLASGLLLLAGAALHYQAQGSLEFNLLGTDGVGGWLILAAFGIKAGFPFVHTWITDGYPQSTPSGTVFLSMFTTKVAVYALARGFAGTEILVPIGTLMAVFPIFYAVIENDLRRVLGYSMINQIGFMVVGVGLGTELALNGAVAHAFNEVLFKGLLFMSVGAVLLRVRHALGSNLGGLYKSMPLTTLFCIVGAASISALPLFSGFVSKSLIMAAMIEAGRDGLWLVLLFASAGVFHHAGITVPYFAFFSHDAGLSVREAPPNMLVAMALAAALCILAGCVPAALYALLPWTVDYVPYTSPHVLAQLQLLLFSGLAFAWLKVVGIYPAELRSVNLDADWLYRKVGALAAAAGQQADRLGRFVARGRIAALAATAKLATPYGRVRQPLGAGAAAFWAGALLAGYLLLYYVGNGS